jgi:hypothetical protein
LQSVSREYSAEKVEKLVKGSKTKLQVSIAESPGVGSRSGCFAQFFDHNVPELHFGTMAQESEVSFERALEA